MKRAMLAALVLSAATAATVQAQLAETIEVRITNVDVVVTDKAGNPVSGLTKADFEVVEAGKPQPITNFYEIRDTAAAMPAVEGQTAAPAAVAEVPEEVSRRRIVIFVDNYTINPLARNQAFAAVEKSLDTLLRRGDEAMIVFWEGTTQDLSPFTADRAALISRFRAATKKTGAGRTMEAIRSQIVEHASQMIADANSPSRRKISHAEAYDISLQNSRAFAENLYAVQNNLMGGLERTLTTLAGVPGKKALIFIGAELADIPGLELFQQIDGMYQQYIRDMKPAIIRESGRSLGAELRKVAQRANANGVTMYLVDSADRSRRSDPTEHMIDPSTAFATDTNTPMAMGTVAAITGGISVPGGRNFEQALSTIAHDLSSYYSLGYRSPAGGEGNRRFEVRVRKPGLRVRSRSSYVARSGEDEIRDRVIANVFHDDVKSDFPISVAAAAPEPTDGGRFKVKLSITIPATLTLIEQDDQLAGEFAVFFATGRPDGALSEVTKSVQPMKFPGDAREQVEAQKTFKYTATLVMLPGEQLVSVGVADTLAGTAGYGRMTVVVQ